MFNFGSPSSDNPTDGLKSSSCGNDFVRSDVETPELFRAIRARNVAVTLGDNVEVMPYLSSKDNAR
ncbi:hypothetical protein BLA29_003333 [Euroglyphus maynei]|uniref:Uncharacterized protein n=1 Tax=Euroglyphus maynei TaxID=6958 RepID=A0A1Y3BUJ8_EURMA|nr:hypothetical protein BLA29_003333 [Euroglyphus maynei]